MSILHLLSVLYPIKMKIYRHQPSPVLHSAGIMHRDLEPQNIQLDGQGHILLTSFGSAEFVKEIIEGEQRATYMSGLRSISSVFRAP